ncbi:MAG: IPExxxVDY family protein [Bacteroidota bacterium]|nr:IPExxxVDY family protein [Bacteroidota bacterium]
MAKKQKLKIEEEYEFTLIGISSHVKDYKICSAFNNELDFNFVRIDDLEIHSPNSENNPSFCTFFFENEENHTKYYLISNKSENGYLIPEDKNSDYFLIIYGPFEDSEITSLISEIKAVDNVITAYETDVNKLKSKQVFLLL